MRGTIEGSHHKFTEKISITREAIKVIVPLAQSLRIERPGKKAAECLRLIDSLPFNIYLDTIETLENSYNLSVIPILENYYDNVANEKKKTQEYYRIITSENFVDKTDTVSRDATRAIGILRRVLESTVVSRELGAKIGAGLHDASRSLNVSLGIEISNVLEKRNYEVCKCGARMIVVPELSELHCPNAICGKIKTIIGAVFRDDQFYPQEGQKTKHGGHDTSRHYRFWIKRLQALEKITIDKKHLDRIEHLLIRDDYDRKTLTCENMRAIFKNSLVRTTILNEHAPLLVKIFGGPSPPQLTFQEHKLISSRFNNAMGLYDVILPDGRNKPYYPYFIYKIIEHEFRDNPVKLRLLDSIHLQSRDTVIKNDLLFEKMCAMATEADGLHYRPTDPAGRL